jgi:hypothetical protein
MAVPVLRVLPVGTTRRHCSRASRRFIPDLAQLLGALPAAHTHARQRRAARLGDLRQQSMPRLSQRQENDSIAPIFEHRLRPDEHDALGHVARGMALWRKKGAMNTIARGEMAAGMTL